MRVRLTQIIDYWVGVPLCALFSVLHWVLERVRPHQEVKPSKILFIEISEMGSAIIAYSSLIKARKLLGTDELYFLVFEKNRESVELLNIIPRDNVITIPDGSFLAFALGALRALRKVRSRGIDTVVDLELFSRFTALFSYASGAANRVGFHNYTAEGLYRGTFVNKRVFYNPHQHMSRNFLALVHALEVPRDQIPMLKRNVEADVVPLARFEPSPGDRARVRAMLLAEKPDLDLGETSSAPSGKSRLIIVNPDPGEALPIRGWPLQYFKDACALLAKYDPSFVFVIIGLQRSKAYADAIKGALPKGSCVDLAGKTRTLSEVVTLFTFGELLFGNDSGPAHFAALTPIRIVTLFGPETPALYGPLSEKAFNIFSEYSCAPCLSAHNHRYSLCRDNQCLKAVTAQAAVERVLSELGAGEDCGLTQVKGHEAFLQ